MLFRFLFLGQSDLPLCQKWWEIVNFPRTARVFCLKANKWFCVSLIPFRFSLLPYFSFPCSLYRLILMLVSLGFVLFALSFSWSVCNSFSFPITSHQSPGLPFLHCHIMSFICHIISCLSANILVHVHTILGCSIFSCRVYAVYMPYYFVAPFPVWISSGTSYHVCWT